MGSGSAEDSHPLDAYLHVWQVGPGASVHDVGTATGMRFGLAPLPDTDSKPEHPYQRASGSASGSGTGPLGTQSASSTPAAATEAGLAPGEQQKAGMESPHDHGHGTSRSSRQDTAAGERNEPMNASLEAAAATWAASPLQSPAVVQEAALLAFAFARKAFQGL